MGALYRNCPLRWCLSGNAPTTSRRVTGVKMQSVDFFDDRDDADLLALAHNGDTRSADILWVRVRPAVLNVARGIARNKHDADDLASEAMTKVFAAIAAGHGPTESVLPYLYATMRNLHISTLRRQAKVGTPVELDEQRVVNLVTVEPDAIESELVTRAFKNLPDRWRYVLWAGLVEGRPGGEIADTLGIKPAAVHALKSRALEGLRQQYLTEHALLSEEQECAAVHRVLASIARGRSRRSTDLNQVWRHLRGCEHCAEGYREITAINSRIGALLGPAAAASLVAFVPHSSGTAALGLLRLPAEAGKYLTAASVAGVVAITGTVLTLEHRGDAAPESSEAVVAATTQDQASAVRTATAKPRALRSTTGDAVPEVRDSKATCRPLAPAPALGAQLPQTQLDSIVPDAPGACAAPDTKDTVSANTDPAATLLSLAPSEKVGELSPLRRLLDLPLPKPTLPPLPVPEAGPLQP